MGLLAFNHTFNSTFGNVGIGSRSASEALAVVRATDDRCRRVCMPLSQAWAVGLGDPANFYLPDNYHS